MAEDVHILSEGTCQALREAARGLTRGVVVICGFPAAGKSSAANYLAMELGAILLEKDAFMSGVEESVMAELTGNPHDRDSATYQRVLLPHVYEALTQAALTIGEQHPVVVDAPYLSYIRRAHDAGAPLSDVIGSKVDRGTLVRTIWLHASPEEIRLRMMRRGAERDRSKLLDWTTYQTSVLDSELASYAPKAVDAVVSNQQR